MLLQDTCKNWRLPVWTLQSPCCFGLLDRNGRRWRFTVVMLEGSSRMSHPKWIKWMNQIPVTLFIHIEKDSLFQNGSNWSRAFRHSVVCGCFMKECRRIIEKKEPLLTARFRSECACLKQNNFDALMSCRPAPRFFLFYCLSSSAYTVQIVLILKFMSSAVSSGKFSFCECISTSCFVYIVFTFCAQALAILHKI